MTSEKSVTDWKKILTPLQFSVLREKGTERAYTGVYDEFFKEGDYYCAGCGSLLFHSTAKYNSGCGWPAFFEPADSANMLFKKDLSHGMVRTEVMCAHCGGHLGHVFNDGPKPTGERYCINSVSMIFKPSAQKEEKVK
jgi:peptide-methionine (R)-S-oxide reductase